MSQTDKGLINLSVDLVEQLGSDNLIYGEIKNKKDFCFRCPGSQIIKKGSKLSLNINDNNYYVFDKSNGNRVN
jgi:ABC-type sugar transport system ATPase subunit